MCGARAVPSFFLKQGMEASTPGVSAHPGLQLTYVTSERQGETEGVGQDPLRASFKCRGGVRKTPTLPGSGYLGEEGGRHTGRQVLLAGGRGAGGGFRL